MNASIKKIVLVVPNFRWVSSGENILWHYIPYNLCLIAAMLEQDYEVKIIDANKENLTQEEFGYIIKQESPDIVGLSVLMDYYGKTAHIAAEIIKKVKEDIITVIGGVYATTNIKQVIKDEHLDYLIAGEGEYAFRELVQYINGEQGNIPMGIYFKQNGEIIGEGRVPFIKDLDELPLPAYHLIDYDKYSMSIDRNSVDRPGNLPYARLFTSRGCPFQCCFCQVKSISGTKFRGRSAKNVLNEITWLKNKYGVKSILFDDDNLFTDRQRVKEILQGLVGKDIEWKATAVAGFLLDDELIELMKASGCTYMDIAIESGCERVIKDIIHKPIRFEQIKHVIKKAKEVGIFVAANAIVGFPGESWDEIRQTLKFMEDIDVDYAKIFNAVPLPKTELYELANAQGYILKGYDSQKIDWRRGWIETPDFKAKDLTILRAHEWDRINFTNKEKRIKIANAMRITEEQLYEIRRKTIESVYNGLEEQDRESC